MNVLKHEKPQVGPESQDLRFSLPDAPFAAVLVFYAILLNSEVYIIVYGVDAVLWFIKSNSRFPLNVTRLIASSAPPLFIQPASNERNDISTEISYCTWCNR